MSYAVESAWFSGRAEVQTFATAELLSTKIRALYQRSKGRDLFDLWLGLTHLDITPAELIDSFGPYRPDGLTARLAVENLSAKIGRPDFRDDLDSLTSGPPKGYDIDAAAQLVIDEVLRRL